MKLLRFTATAIHGYLDFDVRFNSGLTFLTGINGSGKTTVINAIISLLSPSLNVLAELDYKKMSLEIENVEERMILFSEKQDNAVMISRGDIKEPFVFFVFAGESEPSPYRERDAEIEYYRTILSTNTNNAVLRFISSLPTPMFLGLDRRAPSNELNRRSPLRAARFVRNVFSSSLYQSFIDAINLAESAYHDVVISLQRLDLQVRKDVLLNALKVEPASDFGDLTLPTRDSLSEVASMRKDIEALPKILGLDQEEVLNRLLPLLDLLHEVGTALPFSSGDREQIMQLLAGGTEEKIIKRVATWSVNYPQFERIRFISGVIRKYNKDRERIRKRASQYLKLINNFLKDSDKSVAFDEAGRIHFKVEGLKEGLNIKSLSSGEAQIFVLLSHLFFNPAAARANVFIIDEPELSLHIEWQEIFVESMREANSAIQYILATHSPSIILERVSECIEVVAKKRGTRQQ